MILYIVGSHKQVSNRLAAGIGCDFRKLISENALDAGTLAAQMEERERKRRILELREKFQQQREQMQPRLSELQSLLDGETRTALLKFTYRQQTWG